MNRKIRVELAQANPVVGDLEGNAAMMEAWIAEAKARGVDLLAFPELSICGYPTEDLLLKPSFLEDCEKALVRVAKLAKGIIVIAGAPESPGKGTGPLYNTAAILSNGKIAARYRKIHLPNYGVFDEKRYFTAGTKPLVLRIGDISIGVSICEDVWVDDGPTGTQVSEGGADLIVNISASPYSRGKCREREKLMRKRAKEHSVHLCYVNLIGGQDELVFDGSSVICSPEGKTIARGRPFGEESIVADIPVHHGHKPSSRQRKVANRGSGNTATTIEGSVDFADLPPFRDRRKTAPKRLSPTMAEHLAPSEEIYEALVTGTRDYVEKNGFRGVVLGLSGGIDSALTAAVAVDALGPDRVKGVTMPSGYTSSATLNDAKKLATNLGISLYELPIGTVYDSYLSLLGGIIPKGPISITEENIQARIRGNLLMAFSNHFGWLVLTTGNKSEIAVGYCTLYGDMAGGFAVLKDVPKTLVFTLSRYRNRVAGKALIPSSTIRRKPSAELRPDQCDQDSLPPYDMLDRIIELYVEHDMSLRQIVADGIKRKTALDVIRMIDRNEYKRRQGPPGIKITPKAFGRDRRLPITNRYRNR
ncbi:MAG: NAD+ synthase [Candidatus Krumholzibacteria bacterium]|nr:NAD+ synthase [Candidatus Krumholzibacteria bacterium]